MTDREITISYKGPQEEVVKFEDLIMRIQTLLGESSNATTVMKSIVFTSQILDAIYSIGRFLVLVKKPKKQHLVVSDESEVLFNIRKLSKENRKESKKKKKPSK